MRRSRAALMRAAIDVVSEQGTTAVSISDIAAAADVSRQLVYQQFCDRDTLLLDAALDLGQRELLPALTEPLDPTGHDQALAMARHFADHRAFYRAILSGSGGYALTRAFTDLVLPFNRDSLALVYGERLTPQAIEDLAAFLIGGATAMIVNWVVEGDDPLDSEKFTERLLRTVFLLIETMQPLPLPGDEGQDR